VAIPAAVALALARRPALRTAALLAATGALLLAPSVWAFDTLGYATSGTFPEGGPQSAQIGGAPFAGAGAFAVGPKVAGGPAPGAPSGARQGRRPVAGPSGSGAAASGPGTFGGPFGSGAALTGVLSYVNAHGGGTIAVASQSSAAAAIIQKGAAVAGIGGFSGRESDVSAAWLAQQVRSGKIRWVLVEAMGGLAALPGDTRAGATAAMSAAAKACTSVVATGGAIGSGSAGSTGAGSGAGAGAGFGAGAGPGGTGSATLYDCRGHASTLAAAA
jgi:hypothetical protein